MEPYQQIDRKAGASKGLCRSHLWGWLQEREEKWGLMLSLACVTFVEGTSSPGQLPLYFLCALWSAWLPASYPNVLCPLGRQGGKPYVEDPFPRTSVYSGSFPW